MSWRTVEEPGPTRVINGVRYRVWHDPERYPGGEVYVEQNGGAGGPRRYVAIHEDYDVATNMGVAFALHLRPNSAGHDITSSGGVKKERGWWLTFNIHALD